MLSVQEMSAWSLPEIRGEIRRLLPKGWDFECGWDREERSWFTRFASWDEKAADPSIEWEDWQADERISLFDAYGFLWAKQQKKPPADSPWRRRVELTKEAVMKKALELSGPEDLDPNEIKSVYESVRGKK